MNRRGMALSIAGSLFVVFLACGGPDSLSVDAVGPEDLGKDELSRRSRCALCRRAKWRTEVLPGRGKVEFRTGFWCKHKGGMVCMPVCAACWSHMSREQRAEFVRRLWDTTPPDWLNSEQREALLEQIRVGRSGGLIIEAVDVPR